MFIKSDSKAFHNVTKNFGYKEMLFELELWKKIFNIDNNKYFLSSKSAY